MGTTKEADLISAVLRYAVRCLADGDREALRAMNFGPKEIKALRGMHLADLARMESLGAHCLEIGLNRQVYWTLVAHLQRERAAEALQQDLVKADAPFEMMQTFFGLSSREYSRLRHVLAAAPAVGRPPEADEASQQTLWTAWTHRRENADAELLTPEGYLDLHQGDRHRVAGHLEPDPALGRVRRPHRHGHQRGFASSPRRLMRRSIGRTERADSPDAAVFTV